MDPAVTHIFWDNSNIFIRAQDACDDGSGGGFEPGHRLDARINFPALFDLARAARTVEKAVAVGSIPPALQAVWGRLGEVGVVVDLQERGAQSGREQGVDQALQLEMMNSLVDRDPPAVAVLLSGDGGFRPTVDRLLRKGWGVEVLSFVSGFSRRLRIRNAPGGRGRFVELDPWYRQIVYLQDPSGEITRATDPLDLSGRPKL